MCSDGAANSVSLLNARLTSDHLAVKLLHKLGAVTSLFHVNFRVPVRRCAKSRRYGRPWSDYSHCFYYIFVPGEPSRSPPAREAGVVTSRDREHRASVTQRYDNRMGVLRYDTESVIVGFGSSCAVGLEY